MRKGPGGKGPVSSNSVLKSDDWETVRLFSCLASGTLQVIRQPFGA
jgi:hypothetical protein